MINLLTKFEVPIYPLWRYERQHKMYKFGVVWGVMSLKVTVSVTIW